MNKDMMRIQAVIQRDLLKFGRNPLIVIMSIFMPILYLVILGSSFQGKLVGLPMVVVNKDTGWHSRNLLNNLRAIAAGPKTFTISMTDSEQEAFDGVKEGRYKAALIIPSDYSRSVATKANPEIGLFVDNTDMISSDALTASVAGALQYASVRYVPIRDVPGVIYLRDSNLFRQVDYRQSLVPGVVIMAIFLGTLTTGAFNLVMDKFQGIEESYLLTPLTK
ncbi:MAG TPA: ABC transporter permease, partial [Deltaproteobacteria bacterium]|nr:ABC transporter permease [Deltaproteobacteria bacterium]